MGLNVLFVHGCGGSLRSAQLAFNEDQTVRSLECSDALDKAAEFLREHPGALVFFEENPSECGASKMLARLIAYGSPSALITLHAPSLNTVSSEVRIYKADESLRKAFIDGDVLRAIATVWRYCKELSQEPRVVSSKLETRTIM